MNKSYNRVTRKRRVKRKLPSKLIAGTLALALVLTLVISLSNAPTAMADGIYELYYEPNGEDTLKVVGLSYTGDAIHVEIPDAIIQSGVVKNITEIGGNAFSNCPELNSVTIGDNVTTIMDNAFSGCVQLTDISFGTGLISVGNWAFSGCGGISDITIPNSVTSLGEGVFAGARLISITMGTGVSVIPNFMFEGCPFLESITIPNNYTEIGERAFANMGRDDLGASTGKTLNMAIPNGVTAIGNCAFEGCWSLKTITIPNSVTSIGECVFARSTIETITFENGSMLETMGNLAFEGCERLTGITIPDSVQDTGSGENLVPGIGERSFAESGLISVTIGNGVTTIPNMTFEDCGGLATINWGSSVTTIGDMAFAHTAFTGITIPDSVTDIYDAAFWGCESLGTAELGSAVQNLGMGVFAECSTLTAISVASGNESFSAEDGVLFNSDKTTLLIYPMAKTDTVYTIPDSVTEIADYAFAGNTYIETIILGSGVNWIGENAFTGCTSLTSIDTSTHNNLNYTFDESKVLFSADGSYLIKVLENKTTYQIPENVIGIAPGAFEFCTSLASLTVESGNTAFTASDGVLFNSDKTELFIYPIAKTDDTYQIPDTTTNVSDDAFAGNTSITTITFDGTPSLARIGNRAFGKCINLAAFPFENGLVSIGESAFAGTALTAVVIPDSVHNTGSFETDDFIPGVGSGAFEGCALVNLTIGNGLADSEDVPPAFDFGMLRDSKDSLKTLIIGDGINNVDWGLFGEFTALDTLTMGAGVTDPDTVDWGALSNSGISATLKTLTIKALNTIYGDAFLDYTSLASVTLGDGVNTLEGRAFANCTSLDELDLGAVTEIQWGAFEGCTSLTSVTMPGGTGSSIGDGAFYGCAGLTSVTLTNPVDTINNAAFKGCPLTSLTVDGTSVDVLIAPSGENGEQMLIKYLISKADVTYFVPSDVVHISDGAFESVTALKELYIPESVDSIGNEAFSNWASDFTVYGYEGSSANGMANENGIDFKCLARRVIFNPNGGNGDMAELALQYNTDTALTENAFTRDDLSIGEGSDINVSFAGWNTQPYGDGTSYTDMESIKNVEPEWGDTLELFAQWKPDTPSAPAINEITHNKIILDGIPDGEYSMDGGSTWQDSSIFTALDPDTPYTFVQRVKETDGHLSSDTSTTAAFTTYPLPSDALTGTVTVTVHDSGDAVFGATLVATVTDSNAEGDLQYQWKRSNGDQMGEATTTNTYMLTADDIGWQITCEVTDSGTKTGAIESQPTPIIEKAEPAIPDAPTMLSKTYNSITLNVVEGCVYGIVIDGAMQWQDSNIFMGLEPNTEYDFYQRLQETETHKESSLSSKYSGTTDAAPTNPLTGNIRLGDYNAVYGEELSVFIEQLNTTNPAYQWQRDGEDISGATYDTYTLAADDIGCFITCIVTDGAGAKEGCLTTDSTPRVEKAGYSGSITAPALSGATQNSITLTDVSGYEYGIQRDWGIEWQDGNVFSGLDPYTEYTFVQRVKETATHYTSDESGVEQFSTLATPVTVDNVEVTNVTTSGGSDGQITVTAGGGNSGQYQFSIDDGSSWADQNEFTGLSAGTYMVKVRDKDNTENVSAASETVITEPNPQFTATVTITGDTTYGQTLTAAVTDDNSDTDNFTYQWYRHDETADTIIEISDETSSTYTLSADDIANKVFVRAGSDDTEGTVESDWSMLIEKASISVTGDGTIGVTKEYNSTTDAGTLTGELDITGVINSDTVSVSATPGEYDDANVGTGKTVSLTLALTDSDAGNYELAEGTYSYTSAQITRADYTYEAADQNIRVGSGLDAVVAPSEGTGVNSETVSGTLSWYSDSARTAQAVDTDLTGADVGDTVTLFWKFVGNAANYVTTEKTGQTTFTIVAKIPQVFDAGFDTAKNMEYGDAGNTFTREATLSTGDGAITYASSDTGVATVNENGEVTVVGCGSTEITATAAATATYADASKSYTLTVTQKTLTVTAGTYKITKEYDGNTSAGTASGSLGLTGVLGSETVTVTINSVPSYVDANEGDYNLNATLTLGGSDAGNYQLASTTLSVPASITKANLNNGTITPIDAVDYDGSEQKPTITVMMAGSSLSIDTDYTVEYSNNTNVGQATVTATGIGNYTGTKDANFTINKAAPVITVSDATKVNGDPPFNIGASNDVGADMSYQSSTPSVATINSDGLVTIVGAGTTTITVSIADSTNYNTANNTCTVTIEVRVDAQTPSITTDLTDHVAERDDPAITLDATSTVSDGGTISYQWYSCDNASKSNPVALGMAATHNAQTSTVGTYYYYCTVINTNSTVNGDTTASIDTAVSTITINGPVLTGTVSIDNTSPKFGDTLTASITGDNSVSDSFTYKWYRDGSEISGAASNTYTVAQADIGKTIKVRMGSDDTSGYQESAETTAVEKQDGPAAPGTPTTVTCTYKSVTLTATSGYEYSNDNGATWQDSNVFSGLTPETSYVCVQRVKETQTHKASASSTSLTVTTLAAPTDAQVPTIDTQPQDVNYLVGATGKTVSVAASISDGGTLSYQWYSNTTNSTTDGMLLTGTGYNTNTYTVPTDSEGTFYYYCVITNTNNDATVNQTATVTSDAARVIVSTTVIYPENAQVPTIGTQPQDADCLVGDTGKTISVAASVTDEGTLSYQWYENGANSTTGGSKILTGTGYNTNTYTVPTDSEGTTYYYCVITNTNNDATVNKTATATSHVAKVTVSPDPTSTPSPTPAPKPTPKRTPRPTEKPVVTPTPSETHAPTTAVTATPAPEPSESPEPTTAATVTPALESSESPEPTATLSPVEEPLLGTINGVLKDYNGNPLAGYYMILYSDPITTQTDENGYYAFENVPLTAHTLVVANPDKEEIDTFKVSFDRSDEATSVVESNDIMVGIAEGVDEIAADLTLNEDGTVSVAQIDVGNETAYTSVATQAESKGSRAFIWWIFGALIVLAGLVLIPWKCSKKTNA